VLVQLLSFLKDCQHLTVIEKAIEWLYRLIGIKVSRHDKPNPDYHKSIETHKWSKCFTGEVIDQCKEFMINVHEKLVDYPERSDLKEKL
jgi:hypothetical protein